MAPAKMQSQVQCHNCQAGNLVGSPYCSRCGAPLGDSAPTAEHRAPNPAVIAVNMDPVVRFSPDGQDRALVKQTYERATPILTQGESVEYVATGKGGLAHAPDCAVITNKRVMLFRKKVLGKVDLDDCWWRDVSAAALYENKNGFNLKLDAIQGWTMSIENLPRTQASRMYDMAFQYSDRLQGTPRATANPPAESQEEAVPAPSQPAAVPAPAKPAWALSQEQRHVMAPGLEAPSTGGLSPLGMISNNSGGLDAQIAASAAPMPANYIPTPESVLQSILQSSGLEDGVPTRPMQWSAAFQAPAIADIQPITLTNSGPATDTEPHMRPLPPLTTLEKIAVFTPPSGPLSGDGTNRISSPLNSSPLPKSGPLYSLAALDEAALIGSLPDNSEIDLNNDQAGEASGDGDDTPVTGPLQAQQVAPETAQDLDVIGGLQRIALPTTPIDVSAPLAPIVTSGPLQAAGEGVPSAQPEPTQQATVMEWDEATPAPAAEVISLAQSELQPEPQQADDSEYDDFNNARPTAPMGSDDYLLPMPGSTASGPLLAASVDMDLDMEEIYRNMTAMATQRLESEAPSEFGDLPTRINLSLRDMPDGSTAGKRNSGALNRNGAYSDQTSSDETKGSKAAGSRSSSRSKANQDDPIAKMKQLKTMLDAGLITEDDYAAKKADILSRI